MLLIIPQQPSESKGGQKGHQGVREAGLYQARADGGATTALGVLGGAGGEGPAVRQLPGGFQVGWRRLTVGWRQLVRYVLSGWLKVGWGQLVWLVLSGWLEAVGSVDALRFIPQVTKGKMEHFHNATAAQELPHTYFP